MAARVQLVHWNAEEAEEHLDRLRTAGFEAEHLPTHGPTLLRRVKAEPPSAVLIDLDRQPSHGRDVGVALRRADGTRGVPLIFLGGQPRKVAGIRKVLPDAIFSAWHSVGEAVEKALANAGHEPVVPAPGSLTSGGAPLVRKLGIGDDMTVAGFGIPEGFPELLGRLPRGSELLEAPDGPSDLTLWFVRDQESFAARAEEMAARVADGPLWIAWPKKSSEVKTDLDQQNVRDAALEVGLVDYKVCSIDATWSALCFTRRRVG